MGQKKVIDILGSGFLATRLIISRNLHCHPTMLWFSEVREKFESLEADSPDEDYRKFFENDGSLLAAEVENFYQMVGGLTVDSVNAHFEDLEKAIPELAPRFSALKLDANHAQRFSAKVRSKCNMVNAAASGLTAAMRNASNSFELIATQNNTDTSGEELVDNLVTGGLFVLNPLMGVAKLAFSSQAGKKASAQTEAIRQRWVKDINQLAKAMEQLRGYVEELGNQFEAVVGETITATFVQIKPGIEALNLQPGAAECYWAVSCELEEVDEDSIDSFSLLRDWVEVDQNSVEPVLMQYKELLIEAIDVCIESVQEKIKSKGAA